MNLNSLPKPVKYFLRVVIAVSASVATFVIIFFLSYLAYLVSEKTRLFHMAGETSFCVGLALSLLCVVVLCVMWSGNKEAATRIALWGLIGTTTFLGISTGVETVTGNRILSTADSFVPPAGLEREYEMNADEFAVAPALVPCLDFMGEGCPHVDRTWTAESLDREDLEKSLSESGWSNVRIDEDDCDLVDADFKASPRCDAYGMVGEYKADVSIMEITEGKWQMRIYLRSPNSIR